MFYIPSIGKQNKVYTIRTLHLTRMNIVIQQMMLRKNLQKYEEIAQMIKCIIKHT